MIPLQKKTQTLVINEDNYNFTHTHVSVYPQTIEALNFIFSPFSAPFRLQRKHKIGINAKPKKVILIFNQKNQ